ncbi:HA1F protein, partial [Upupa epops]|nr:HA1F protein [Upupa epops]
LKDGEVRDQDTEWGSILPNGDGTYYTQASIKARPEDKDKYRCRVEHASLAEPGLFALEPKSSLLAIVLGVVVPILVIVAAVPGFIFWKMRRNEAAQQAEGCNMAPSE